MSSLTLPSCVFPICLYFDPRVLIALKIRHPLNMLSVSGLITVHRVRSGIRSESDTNCSSSSLSSIVFCCGGGCLLTECTPRLPLGSPKKNLMLCFLTGLPGATTRIRMKKNHVVVLQSKKSKHGGNNAKSGWHTSKDKMRRWSSTSRAFWRHFLVRKQKLSRKWMHLWSIVQKGGRLERALINSSDVDWSLTLETRLRV